MTEKAVETTIVHLPAVLTVKQLADSLEQPVTAVIAKLMGFGVLATINEDIDFDTAAIIADDFGFAAEREVISSSQSANKKPTEEAGELTLRPPIVTIMGHVDHGKTTLLDAIRKTNVAAKEAGGITQHISSYQIEITQKDTGEKRMITFLDTPGHSAFEAMRRHGAKITDLVVLVVAADDGVKPQTLEAIKHARAMQVPILVAVNKIDRPDADIERVKAELAEHDLVPEEWGGKTVVTPISATKNQGISELLDLILLSTDLRELKANLDTPAVGVVIESHLQPGIGPVATILIQNGSLKIGDYVAIADISGKVRTLTDYRGKRLATAGPSTPVEISGLTGVPPFGEQLAVFSNEKDAKESARQFIRSQSAKRATVSLSSSLPGASQKEGQKSILNLVIKADTKGSLEAIKDALKDMHNDDVEVRVISEGVGDVAEGDISMAQASRALVIGFQVRLPAVVKMLADREKVAVSLYSVVYELFDAIRSVLADLMPIIIEERDKGLLKVLAVFRDNRKNKVLGGMVEEGAIIKGLLVKLERQAKLLGQGTVISVQKGKNEVKEVLAGSECGLEINFDSLEVEPEKGDHIHFYLLEQVKKPSYL